eukprot:Clim_evm39s240 gene=Clim_evmTU39s240
MSGRINPRHTFGPEHVRRVQRLYRHSLKNILNWTVIRQDWRDEALKLRDRFDANMYIYDYDKVQKLVEEGEAELESKRHPEPYVRPWDDKGTKFERNIPPPAHICEMTPEEEAWYNMRHLESKK